MDDQIAGSVGNAMFDGGGGTDTVIYGKVKSDFQLSKTAFGFLLEDNAGSSINLVNVERLRFSDKSVALDVDGIAGQAYRLYEAAFDRTPDAAGIGFWIKQMDQGLPLQTVANEFAGSSEFMTLYGKNASNADIISKFYQNILGRAPEQAGFNFWVGVLDNKQATVAEVLYNFTEGFENKSAVAQIIGQGFEFLPFGG